MWPEAIIICIYILASNLLQCIKNVHSFFLSKQQQQSIRHIRWHFLTIPASPSSHSNCIKIWNFIKISCVNRLAALKKCYFHGLCNFTLQPSHINWISFNKGFDTSTHTAHKTIQWASKLEIDFCFIVLKLNNQRNEMANVALMLYSLNLILWWWCLWETHWDRRQKSIVCVLMIEFSCLWIAGLNQTASDSFDMTLETWTLAPAPANIHLYT